MKFLARILAQLLLAALLASSAFATSGVDTRISAFDGPMDFEFGTTGTNLNPNVFYKDINFSDEWAIQSAGALGFSAVAASPAGLSLATISFGGSGAYLNDFDYLGAGLLSIQYAAGATQASQQLFLAGFGSLSQFLSMSNISLAGPISSLSFVSTFSSVDNLSVSPTPIPATLWMLVSGLLGLVGVRRFA